MLLFYDIFTNLQKHIMSATMARIADNNRQKNFIK